MQNNWNQVKWSCFQFNHLYLILEIYFLKKFKKISSISKSGMSTNFQACINSHDFSSFFSTLKNQKCNNIHCCYIVLKLNVLPIEVSAKKVTKTAPTSEDFLGTNTLELRNIYSLKSHKPFPNRSFVTNFECITSLFVKIMPKTQVLKQKIRLHRAAILNFGMMHHVL